MLQFQILDLISDDLEIEDEIKYIITVYGKTENNLNIVANIHGFLPYFYMKYPLNWSKSFVRDSFLHDRYLNIGQFLENNYKNDENYISSNELYGYHMNKSNFVKLSFTNIKSMKSAIRFIKKYCEQEINISVNLSDIQIKNREFIDSSINDYRGDSNLYESNCNPLLRFIHFSELKTSGWCEIFNEKSIEIDKKQFNTDLEYNVNYKYIKPVDRSDINGFIIASFDIECDSLHGDFPTPYKDFKKLAIDITDAYKKFPSVSTDIMCKSLLIDWINSSFNNGDEYIHSIKFENGPVIPESINKLLTNKLSEIRILLDNSKEDSKSRDLCVNELNKLFKRYLKNKDDENIIVTGDPVIQIGTVFHRYGENTPYDRSIIVIGPENNMIENEICDDLNGINVYRCSNERELLLKWKDLILKHNPDYITGYNIFGFDFDFIIKRVERLFPCEKKCKFNKFTNNINHHYKCDCHAFYRLGRLMKHRDIDNFNNIDLDNTIDNKIVQSRYYKHTCKRCEPITKYLGGINTKEHDKSIVFASDFSHNTLKYINMDGRIIFDVQNEVKKSVSLDSYKLDNVASHFMRGKIIKKKNHKNLSCRIETNDIGNLKIGDYISISITTKYGPMKYNNGKKYYIKDLSKKTISVKGTINGKTFGYGENFVKAEWNLAKDDISPQELFDAHKNLDPIEGPKGRARIAKYCIMDCELCIHILLSQDFIPNNMGMSSVCYVPQPYIFLRGQGIKVQSLVTKYSNDYNIRVPTLKQFNEDTDDNSGFEGAIVLEPTTGLYLDDPVAVLDYASLYPTSIKEKNLSHDTYFGEYNDVKDKLDDLGWKKGVDYNCIEYNDYVYETKPGTSVIEKKPVIEKGVPKVINCVFVTENGKGGKKGIINIAVSALLEQRSATKKLLKKEKDENKKKVLDGYQLAYKLTANSVYGQLGAKTSSISFKKVAACTTAIGRERIYDAKDLVMDWAIENNKLPPQVVYGDTDSIFVKFNRNDNGKTYQGKEALAYCIQCGKDAGIYITKKLHEQDKAPQDLEYEKTFWPFILISKKRYTGDKYEMSAYETPKRTSMGLVTKRRDNAPIVKYVFGNLINKFMYDKNLTKTLKWLEDTLKNIIEGKEHISMFMLSKTLNSYYKNPQSIPHKVLADRIGERDPGNKPKANDRIPYAYIEIDDKPVFIRFKKAYEMKGSGEYKQIKKRMKSGEYYKKDEIINDGFYINGKPKVKKIKVDNKDKPKYVTQYVNGPEIMKKMEVPGEPVYRKKVILQGERIEHPDYIKENNKKLDYKFYISNQIMNPVRQVLDISMKPEDSKKLFDKFLQ